MAELTGRLLPAVATPREVTGARVAYDPATGTLIRPEGLAPGLRYTVDLGPGTPGREPAGHRRRPGRRRRWPGCCGSPTGCRSRCAGSPTQLAEENGAPYARAAAIEQFLAEHYRVVADAPSGHAYPNLAFFLFGPRNGGGQQGTSEQFAAAFAVLGRLTGLPTRVVVGFRAHAGSGPVRAGDAFAWPEVLFDGLGWVPFDPLPQPGQRAAPGGGGLPADPEDPPPSEVPAPTVEPTATPTGRWPPRPGGRTGRRARHPGAGRPAAAVGLLLLVGLALLTLLALRRALTRARLSGVTPANASPAPGGR